MRSGIERHWQVAGVVALVSALVLVGAGIMFSPGRTPSDYQSETSSATSRQNSLRDVRVAVIGDSYTSGTELGGYGSGGWPALLEARLYTDLQPVIFSVAGRPGAGYSRKGAAGTTFAMDVPQVVDSGTDVVVIFGSRTDAGLPVRDPALRAIEAVREITPKSKIMLIAPAWVDDEVPGYILDIRDALRVASDESDVEFVDPISEGWFFGSNSRLIGADGIHPTAEGHVYMADLIQPRIESVIQELEVS